MKKSARRILNFSLIIFVILILVIGFPLFKMKSETGKMNSCATGEIVKGIFAVHDDFVNLYLVKTSNGYIAIDAGNDKKIITAEMQKLKIDPLSVTAVFLTHSDKDHTGGLPLFKNATVYLSGNEEQMINGKTRRMLVFHNKMLGNYKLLADNETVTPAGLTIRCIATPGHTPGSMCYVINGTFLFTGDTLSLKNGEVEPFNDFFNMDTPLQKESLKKLAVLKGIKYIITAHYGFSDKFEGAFKNLKKPDRNHEQ